MKFDRVLVGCLALAACSGCFVRDTEALHNKILNECRVVPLAPACVDHTNLDDPTTSRVWTGFLEDVNSDLEQNCILDLDCADETTQENAVLSIPACFHLDDPEPLPWEEPEPEPVPAGDLTDEQQECLIACSDLWFATDDPCGNPDGTCTAELVDSCEGRDQDCSSECRD